MHEESSEATYTVRVICSCAARPEVMDQLLVQLEAANYPVRDIDQHAFGPADFGPFKEHRGTGFAGPWCCPRRGVGEATRSARSLGESPVQTPRIDTALVFK